MRIETDAPTPRVESQAGWVITVRERMFADYTRLKPGPGQSPGQVRASQRGRLCRAMTELAAEGGYEHVTVRALTAAAGVSSRTFYGHFRNQEDCLAETVRTVGHDLLCRAVRSGPDNSSWTRRVDALIHSLFIDLADRPEVARLLFLEAVAAGRPARTRAKELTGDLEQLLAHLLAKSPYAPAPPDRLVIGVAAGIVRVATMATLTGRAEELPNLAAALSRWVFAIYTRETVATATRARNNSNFGVRRERCPLPANLSTVRPNGDYERILAAVARLAADHGFGAVSAPRIRREAGVSRRTLDAWFDDATDCYLAAVESLARTSASKAAAWSACTGGTEHRIYRTLLALSAMAARNQGLARLVIRGVLAPGREGLLRRELLISRAAAHLPPPPAIPGRTSLAAEASAAAVWRIAAAEVSVGRAARLLEATPFLSLLISLPSPVSASS